MNNDLERLRKLILGAEYDELLALKARLNDESELSATLSSVITEALSQRELADSSVSEVLAPSIDRAISSSINQDPRKLAESLYPIMGPAIRKSISETLQQMLENFNDLLEQSLSPKSLKWRLDAWRTGRSYSELVLLNTLEFRVEQVFLIHAETSLLAQHVVHEMAQTRDADMVSGMFSAIQDFIQDSFDTGEGDVLDTLRLGDLTVIIVRGPLAFLAVVVRGRPPEQLRRQATEALEDIHRLRRRELADYEGDPDVFAGVAPLLQTLVQDRKREDDASPRSIPWLAVVVIVGLGAVGGYYFLEQARIQNDIDQSREAFVAAIDARPGVVVLESDFRAGNLVIKALRDPLADPLDLEPPPAASIDSLRINERAFVSVEDEILERRANRLFAPGTDSRLSVDGGLLRVAGRADVDWVTRLEEQHLLIEGIVALDTSGASIVDPRKERFEALEASVQSFSIDFDRAETELEADDALINLADQLSEILALQQARGQSVVFDIVGATDATGTVEYNRLIGRQRAESLIRFLTNQGIPAASMSAFAGVDYEQTASLQVREVRIFVEPVP